MADPFHTKTTDSKETRVQLQTRPGQRQCWDPSRKHFYLLHLYNRAINKQFQRRLTCSRRETPTSSNCTSIPLPILLGSAPSPTWPDDCIHPLWVPLRWLGYVGFGAPPCGNRKWYYWDVVFVVGSARLEQAILTCTGSGKGSYSIFPLWFHCLWPCRVWKWYWDADFCCFCYKYSSYRESQDWYVCSTVLNIPRISNVHRRFTRKNANGPQ